VPFALGLAAILIGLGSPAQGQIFWQDDYPDVYIEEAPPPFITEPQSHRARHHRLAKTRPAAKDGRKPKGPIIIAISIRRQTLKVYDANGLFAETPVSTGMPGHSTPMGVFSVIQKQKWHRSNIYSNAPMPYMQRITWSGIAMHAGVLPGYPASHGCIRMPMNFAVKMWGWTRIGARVIITPGEVTPKEFSHPVLMTHRPEPAPVAVGLRTADATSAMEPAAASPAPPATNDQTATAKPAAEPIKPDTGNMKDADASAAATVKSDAETTAAENDRRNAGPADDVVAATQDQSQPTGGAQAEPPTIPALKRSDRIAVFISRKDGKIYVRQNFAPLFDAPVTITPSDRPLGTHVFTAETGTNSMDGFRWSVVSLPAIAHNAGRVHLRERKVRVDATRPAPVPDSAADALDRISLPEDVMTKIADSLSAGDSIVVSDQGIAGGETGQGTDFIVTLR
jgi:hypothetical protein